MTLKVLSLFDGISCGQLALQKLKIKNYLYYASEIEKNSKRVTQSNFPNTIQLGDVKNIKSNSLPEIDLLIGGVPCQGFSYIGKQLNFADPQSKLIFEYVRILNEIKPKYFILENVKMKAEWVDIISKELKVTPILINSNLVSAQNRKRLYWTNIKNIRQPMDKGIKLIDILELPIDKELKIRTKSKCVRVGGRGSYDRHEWDSVDMYHKRKLTIKELERLQTIPDNYTSGVCDTHRYKMIGNAMTVDVIGHILGNI